MLYLVPTPIGNKEDITLRALRLFKEIKYFISEDTRTTKKLFQMYEIQYTDKEFFSLTSFTNEGRIQHFINILKENDVVLTSEAGTPGLSDPGKLMIQRCLQHNIPYSILPGANALVPAIVGAGFDTSHFVFLGFLPTKKGRQTIMKQMLQYDMPVFFYESVHRIEKTLQELKKLGFTGTVSVARELSKMYEQYITASVDDVLEMLKNKQITLKGEFVVGIRK